MKKGDVVTVNDGSYSRSLINKKLIHEAKCWRNEQFVIIETGCSFPNTGGVNFSNHPTTFNNTVIQAIDSGKVVFIEERFLKLVPPKHKIMVDVRQDGGWMYGQIVEISDELYKQIKK